MEVVESENKSDIDSVRWLAKNPKKARTTSVELLQKTALLWTAYILRRSLKSLQGGPKNWHKWSKTGLCVKLCIVGCPGTQSFPFYAKVSFSVPILG